MVQAVEWGGIVSVIVTSSRASRRGFVAMLFTNMRYEGATRQGDA